MRGPPPGGGAVHMVHVEDTSVAVDARLPVCTHTQEVQREGGGHREGDVIVIRHPIKNDRKRKERN